MSGHEFTPLHREDAVGSYVRAACSCGWHSSYIHASETEAAGDHDFHVQGARRPTPGSTEAIHAGCICPVLDNAHGWGYWREGEFVVFADCPLHGVGGSAT